MGGAVGEPFRCVAMDPPWNERGGGKSKRGADRHYPLMRTPDIARVITECPHWSNVADSAHLWMWVTDNYLRDGLGIMEALGFRYVRMLIWVKKHRITHELQVGLGQYLRGSHEACLFGVRGETCLPDTPSRFPSVFFAERTRHSEKPNAAYVRFEAVSPGPRLEMFARQPREGWTVWGNEVNDG